MHRVQSVPVEPMTAEAFAPFGTLYLMHERPAGERRTIRWPFECDGRTTVSTIWQPAGGREFTLLERHHDVTQAFVQIDGDPAVVCVAAPTGPQPESIPRPEHVRAFLIPSGVPYAFHRRVWHSLDRFVLGPTGATFVILNTEPNPTQVVDYADGACTLWTDLDADPEPARRRLPGTFGVRFELGL
ncbi:MAG: ureidoglycolate lyase [Ectothiorhodospiraceae bacterium]|nr:ureidoglycolate lyase [Ectothiorhodospiraceae bacterium]